MIKYLSFSIGCGLALSLAACSPPAAEQSPVETPAVETSKPDASTPQTREDRPRRPEGGERRAPPESAYTACATLAAEAACSFETPRGTRTGVCGTREGDDRAVCMGQRPEGGRRGEGGPRPDGQRPRGEQ